MPSVAGFRRTQPASLAWVMSIAVLAAGFATRTTSVRAQAPLPFPGDESMRPDRLGTLRLRETTHLGELRLKPGRYEFRYRPQEAEGLLHVMEVRKEYVYARSAWQSRKYVGEVECRVARLAQPAPETVASVVSQDGTRRIAWIEIAGHPYRCLPEASSR